MQIKNPSLENGLTNEKSQVMNDIGHLQMHIHLYGQGRIEKRYHDAIEINCWL